jgi:hypothetical protein
VSETAGKQIPKSHKTALEPYIGSGESVEDVLALGAKTYVLTDERLVSYWQSAESGSGRERRKVETYPLDQVTSTTVDFHGEEPVDQEALIAGGGSALIGLLSIVSAAIVSEQGLQLLALLAGVVFVLIGGYYIIQAYDTDSAFVQLRLDLVDGSTEHVSLPESGKRFVGAVTSVVGEQ